MGCRELRDFGHGVHIVSTDGTTAILEATENLSKRTKS